METNQRKTIKEIAKEVRQELKKEFPACKFSVRIQQYSMGRSMTVSLLKAPFEAFSDINEPRKYCQLNQFTLRRSDPTNSGYNCNGTTITKEARECMKKADKIANRENWDRSDSMTDHYDVNYAFNIEIGQWDKPFERNA